ncbi:MAG: carboxypeptidase regulatory-like domain-containing protein [Acidobacteriaceae bacterium]
MLPRFHQTLRLAVSLLLAAISIPAIAQSTGSIQGSVTDASGAAIPNATVNIKNTAQALQRTVTTDSAGAYNVPALPPGTYAVDAQSQGFQHQVVQALSLAVGSNLVQNFRLSPSSVNETVTVTEEAPQIDSSTITVGQTIEQKVVQEIPLNGRHFVDLGLLIPGSVTPPQNGFLTAPLRGQGSFSFNTAGNREDTVNFMINGINLNDMVQNQITFQPSINTVSEFKVDNSTYSAEYGRNSGAIVNIATRSGTNQFHGEGFEFIRNNALDARNYFNPKGVQQSPFKRNQFGASLGGPIIRDKTFFFFSYEGLRQRQGVTVNTGVPSAAQRATVVDPTSQKLLGVIPVANDATGTRFIGSATAPVNIDQFTGDVSHNLNDKIRLHGYYAWQRDFRQEPTLQGNNIPGFGDTRSSHRQILTLEASDAITSSLVNETRLGFNRIKIDFVPNNKLDPTTFGINNGQSGPIGLPEINIGGLGTDFGGPSGFPQGRGDTTAVAADTVNYLRGKHNFKIGAEYRRFYNNNFGGDNGFLSFTNFTNFAIGNITGFQQTVPGPNRVAVNSLGVFVQDSYKVTRRLLLELGLRYDWNATPTEARDRFVNFLATSDSLQQVSQPYQQSARNFQPRVGFAYDLLGNGNTVIRGAYAIMTDQPNTGLVNGLSSNPPLANPLNLLGTATYATVETAAGASGLAPIAVDPNYNDSYMQQYNFNIQQQVSNSVSLMVGYFGNKGTDLRTRVNENQFIGGLRPFPTLSAASPILPGTKLGNISENVSHGTSNYNALWVSSNMRPWHNLQFNASYTYSKSLDETSQNGLGVVVQNSYDIRGDYGLSDYDARHRFVINFIYDLPFQGNRVVSGWQFGSIIQLQTGNPVNILASGAKVNSNSLTGVASLRPDLTGPVQYLDTRRADGAIQWFAPSVCDPTKAALCALGTTFTVPFAGGTYHFGDLGRNSVIGPGFDNTDFSIIKNTKLTERLNMQLRAEAFDLFNHPNFGQPGRVALAGSTTFGAITSTRFPVGDSGSSRQLQFAVKLQF